MKKFKLLTSLSSLAIIGTSIPIVATACASKDENENNTNNYSISNTSTIDIERTQQQQTIVRKFTVKNGTDKVKSNVTWLIVPFNDVLNDYISIDNTNGTITITVPAASANDVNIAGEITVNAKVGDVEVKPVNVYIIIRRDSSSGGGGETPVSLMTETTYDELLNLREKGNLIPGHKYRITDYECTTTEPNSIASKHRFDIIVTAISNNTLNENCQAAPNANESYFNEARLDAWELKYCLDNDSTRFNWADAGGKGVIYYMKDEWDNEAPYDFKNILYHPFTWTAYDDADSDPYKNDNDELLYYYTFSNGSESTASNIVDGDGTITGPKGKVCSNSIQPAWGNYEIYGVGPQVDRQILNRIVIIPVVDAAGQDISIKANVFGKWCCNITLAQRTGYPGQGSPLTSNIFGNSCINIEVDPFGNNYGSITGCNFGTGCMSLKIDHTMLGSNITWTCSSDPRYYIESVSNMYYANIVAGSGYEWDYTNEKYVPVDFFQ